MVDGLVSKIAEFVEDLMVELLIGWF